MKKYCKNAYLNRGDDSERSNVEVDNDRDRGNVLIGCEMIDSVVDRNPEKTERVGVLRKVRKETKGVLSVELLTYKVTRHVNPAQNIG